MLAMSPRSCLGRAENDRQQLVALAVDADALALEARLDGQRHVRRA